MSTLIGERTLWVIPLETILNDVEPTIDLCRVFHFTPKQLVEGFIHEWFRFKRRLGPYQFQPLFEVGLPAVIDEVKSIYLQYADPITGRSQLADVEQVINLTGYTVFEHVASYVRLFGVPLEEIQRMEIVGWCYKSLVVRFP